MSRKNPTITDWKNTANFKRIILIESRLGVYSCQMFLKKRKEKRVGRKRKESLIDWLIDWTYCTGNGAMWFVRFSYWPSELTYSYNKWTIASIWWLSCINFPDWYAAQWVNIRSFNILLFFQSMFCTLLLTSSLPFITPLEEDIDKNADTDALLWNVN